MARQIKISTEGMAPQEESNAKLNIFLLECLTRLIRAQSMVKKPESKISLKEARELVESVLRNEETKPVKSTGHHGG